MVAACLVSQGPRKELRSAALPTERKALNRVHLTAVERVWKKGAGGPGAPNLKETVKRQAQQGGDLVETTFPNFSPLLRAAQDYARLSGCRFLGRDFRAELARGCGRSSGCSPSLLSDPCNDGAFVDTGACGEHPLARAAASADVEKFACRLSQGDSDLLKELNLAFDLIMAESIRSTMVGKCRELDMWPPTDPSSGVPSNEVPTACHCDYIEEVIDPSSSLPSIARLLYNDEQQRKSRKTSSALTLRKAMMASFLTDFAAEVGIGAPDMPARFVGVMEQFSSKALEWEDEQEAEERQRRSIASVQQGLLFPKSAHDVLSFSALVSWVDRLSFSSDSEASFSTFISSQASRSDNDSSSEDENITADEILSL
mmetsp:Transcript_66281/g.158563  ORF Transcript_66281/g.158563 Transcript_66281/m.158563 type:complete len:371 (-) Transcript_66281:306-1418(-)|eukprot:CAMPEP_0178437342 /NCGR_PEP_ID=MMETSP0689_2-20121128/34937_1 /TAXON_ID=160604 /ORGANISM="Amphidinium massartii, Strain CS-259" /LENGTH=370 /DNA_ID=CAMNT_0020059529 /DNA_START=47 /DNA_END=1159 /DNA_ORIENTATION=-